MSKETLERRFAAMGARVRIADGPWHGEPMIDVRGERFVIGFRRGGAETELEVVDVRPRDRHLLLLARVDGQKSKFLCGHDERHWLVAAVPEEARGVTGVTAAKAARNEPLLRGAGSTPHVMQFAHRRGGTVVYLHPRYRPAGVTAERYAQLDKLTRRAAGWMVQLRDPEVYAKAPVWRAPARSGIV